jgi:hypothetical protein
VREHRELLAVFARFGELPVSPRLTLVEVARRWLAGFEAKVAGGERRAPTLDFYRSRPRCHLLSRLGRLQLRSITPTSRSWRELRAEGSRRGREARAFA